MSELVKVEVASGIQIITINRPATKNAINLPTAQAMAAALTMLDSRADVRIGILTGADGVFSSGMDLKAFAQTGERPHIPMRGFAGLTEALPQKPLIAALNETLGYQQKIKAQNEMLQQAAAAKNGQNSAVMGAGQMPSDGAPAAPAPAPAPVAPPAPSP